MIVATEVSGVHLKSRQTLNFLFLILMSMLRFTLNILEGEGLSNQLM